MKPHRGKVIVLTSGLLLAPVLIAALTFWKDLVASYHLKRLREDTDYFLRIVDRPDGSPEAMAVRAYARSHDGATAVLSTLVGHFQPVDKEHSPGLASAERAVIGFGEWSKLRHDEVPGLWYGMWFKNANRRGQTRLHPSFNVQKHVGMVRLLDEMKGQEGRLPEYPGFRFAVLTKDMAFHELREWGAARTDLKEVQFFDAVGTDFEKHSHVILAKGSDS